VVDVRVREVEATEVPIDRVVARDLATVVFAAVFGATVLDVVILEALVLCVPVLDALALVACAFALLALPPELVCALAGAAGRLTKATMRQMSVAVFQLNFRAMYFASPRGSLVLLPSFASCF
jgi:hypothetical protein